MGEFEALCWTGKATSRRSAAHQKTAKKAAIDSISSQMHSFIMISASLLLVSLVLGMVTLFIAGTFLYWWCKSTSEEKTDEERANLPINLPPSSSNITSNVSIPSTLVPSSNMSMPPGATRSLVFSNTSGSSTPTNTNGSTPVLTPQAAVSALNGPAVDSNRDAGAIEMPVMVTKTVVTTVTEDLEVFSSGSNSSLDLNNATASKMIVTAPDSNEIPYQPVVTSKGSFIIEEAKTEGWTRAESVGSGSINSDGSNPSEASNYSAGSAETWSK